MTYRCFFLLIVIGSITCSFTYAQESTGIFAIIKLDKKYKTKGYGRRVYTRNNRERFLIPDQALIGSAQFTAIRPMEHDLRTLISYFDIIVTAEGMMRLRNTITALPDTELILLIDNTVFGRISTRSEEDFKLNKITIASPIKDADLQWAHTQLEEIIKAREK